MFEVGQTLGHYRIVSRLSEGGMATLLLGRHIESPNDEPVAIKVIHEHLSEDWQFVRMFIDEALISVRIRHPNVVRVDELGEQNNNYYLVMEYVHGCSLAQLLRAMGKQGRRMRPEIAVSIAQQVAAGLHAAHEMRGDDGAILGVVHRDVSPQNVLLSVDGQVKLLDFGIAKARGRAERTEAGVIKGKVRYMAPEQAIGADIDRRIDVYALGVVLWEMLTMRRYIEGKNEVEILRKVQSPDPVPPSMRVQGIARSIDDAVMAALAKAPDQRPPTAADFETLLHNAVPPGTITPAHVAELLRLFVADEIEAAARALPAEVGAPIAERVRGHVPIPGVEGDDEETRVATLTDQAPKVSFEEAESSGKSALSGQRRIAQEQPAAGPPASAGRPTIGAIPSQKLRLGEPGEISSVEVDPGLASHAGLSDEATVESGGAELKDFLARIRADAQQKNDVPAVPSSFRSADVPAAPPRPMFVPSLEQPIPTAPEEKSRSVAGWIVRVLLITVLAFALGAGVAVLWVRFFAS